MSYKSDRDKALIAVLTTINYSTLLFFQNVGVIDLRCKLQTRRVIAINVGIQVPFKLISVSQSSNYN